MTVKELRERLKHIAGLCYGLSADLQYLENENARLKADNEGLEALLRETQRALSNLRNSRKCAAKARRSDVGTKIKKS